jgi:hypothetical protein
MLFGGKFRYKKEYEEALDVLGERGHWLYLYDSLDGPKGHQVLVALRQWLEAYQAKKKFRRPVYDGIEDDWNQVMSDEQRLKREVHLLIYGEFTEGIHGYVSDDE